jgi:hypothetical protein
VNFKHVPVAAIPIHLVLLKQHDVVAKFEVSEWQVLTRQLVSKLCFHVSINKTNTYTLHGMPQYCRQAPTHPTDRHPPTAHLFYTCRQLHHDGIAALSIYACTTISGEERLDEPAP